MIAKKVPVMELVKFRRLSEKSQATFVNNLKIPKKPKSDSGDGGGNYWVRSISCVSNAFKKNDNKLIQDKIDEVTNAYNSAKLERTRTMHKRNLEILYNYIGFDFESWWPTSNIQILANPQLTLTIKGIPIQVIPSCIFSYEIDGEQKVGGLWFVCWLDGFKPDDLGIFSESLFRYLSFLFEKRHTIEPKDCYIVDISTMDRSTYQELLDGKIDAMLENTINTLNKYL
ncbi:hypothetical protein IDJ75_01645 [Mucilaginibacter rigui]|uniref:Uncharacterized protein n=1 Tax=Mucilaginibacter rigui TaxID=534635 RepID=A0ABR7X049_9SPHI|nr:hypothetical protein [Mucilaginibacter rigui]MBD1383966.1 hypothetical protein [Mucilaginibacter rigui]